MSNFIGYTLSVISLFQGSDFQRDTPVSNLHYSFDHTAGAVVEEKVSGQYDSVQYAFTKALYKPQSDPLWRKSGVTQQALLFDGYSTFIEKTNFTPAQELTLAVWVAPRAFEWGDEGKLSAIINQQDLPNKKGFALGMYRHGAWSFQCGDGAQWVELWDQEHPLPKNEWSFVVATLSEQGAAIYLNGKKINEKKFSTPFQLAAATDQKLLIGRHNQAAVIEGDMPFSLNMFNGLMDELWVKGQFLSEGEVHAMYLAYLPTGKIPKIPYQEIALDYSKFNGDRYRPTYHAVAPAHWMNEPHAPFYYGGKYHLFYQHNPTGPYWHQIHWGHWVSDDMINWQHAPVALAPEKGDLTPDGIWSGSAHFDAKGEPVLYFTAGNDGKKPNQAVAIARPKNPKDPNLIEWIYHPKLVAEQPQGYLFNEFRDPFVWKEGTLWYMLVGSGIEGKGGTAALFTSSDALTWEYSNPFFLSDSQKYPRLGDMWELPVFLPVGKYKSGETRYILLVSPLKEDIHYWLGRFDKKNNRFIPDQEAPQLMDYGKFGFTGPSGMVDPKTGRSIVFSIAQGKYRGLHAYNMGWAHNAGLPLSLSVDQQGRLLFEPIQEVENKRGQQLLSLKNMSLVDANKALATITGDVLEIKVTLEHKGKQPYGLIVRKSPTGAEQTKLYYNPEQETFGIDRMKTSQFQENGIDEGPLSLAGAPFELRVFLDKSMLEAYVNKRRSITSRTYCALKDALGIEVFGDPAVQVKSLEVWALNPIDWQYVSPVPQD
ncbi:GH32 C-terminal domain-containing protein [Cesiribacter andamanensis]|uniref:beta-fructofuranosidase n=1 Tax=Cesiribacter andamanensis AMV16 TaxID=1279009 RepID=M7NBP9_9BACT|nr:GH32 C-terminal domain-containing protein [Cesiribacter andamanensis]EMR04677.1 Sucrose-6-phosphate hydrolase [Cesiribacter andamanensis AMV16]